MRYCQAAKSARGGNERGLSSPFDRQLARRGSFTTRVSRPTGSCRLPVRPVRARQPTQGSGSPKAGSDE
eukprot:7137021-Prymnesium_polylepis.1